MLHSFKLDPHCMHALIEMLHCVNTLTTSTTAYMVLHCICCVHISHAYQTKSSFFRAIAVRFEVPGSQVTGGFVSMRQIGEHPLHQQNYWSLEVYEIASETILGPKQCFLKARQQNFTCMNIYLFHHIVLTSSF